MSTEQDAAHEFVGLALLNLIRRHLAHPTRGLWSESPSHHGDIDGAFVRVDVRDLNRLSRRLVTGKVADKDFFLCTWTRKVRSAAVASLRSA